MRTKMKLPTHDKLAVIALTLARSAIPKYDPKAGFIHAGNVDAYEADLIADGTVSLKAKSAGSGRITLSMTDYFKIKPIIVVKAKTGKVFAGPKSYALNPQHKASADYRELAEIKLKKYTPK